MHQELRPGKLGLRHISASQCDQRHFFEDTCGQYIWTKLHRSIQQKRRDIKHQRDMYAWLGQLRKSVPSRHSCSYLLSISDVGRQKIQSSQNAA